MTSPAISQIIPRGTSPATSITLPQVNSSQKPTSATTVKVMQQVLTKKDDVAFQAYEEGYIRAQKLIEELQKSLQTANQKIALVESYNVILETQKKEAAKTHAAALQSNQNLNAELKAQIVKQEKEIARFIRNEKIYEEEFTRQENEQRELIRTTPQLSYDSDMISYIIAEHESILNRLLKIKENASKKL